MTTKTHLTALALAAATLITLTLAGSASAREDRGHAGPVPTPPPPLITEGSAVVWAVSASGRCSCADVVRSGSRPPFGLVSSGAHRR